VNNTSVNNTSVFMSFNPITEQYYLYPQSHIYPSLAMIKKSSEDQTDNLTMAGFSLLNLVLSNWFRPDPVDEACRQARLELLEDTSQYCDLCTLLLWAHDGSLLRGGGHKEKSLVGHTLAVLLACSDTAKNTALKG